MKIQYRQHDFLFLPDVFSIGMEQVRIDCLHPQPVIAIVLQSEGKLKVKIEKNIVGRNIRKKNFSQLTEKDVV